MQGLAKPKRPRIVTSDDESAATTPAGAAPQIPAQPVNVQAANASDPAPSAPLNGSIHLPAPNQAREIEELSDDDMWVRPFITVAAPVETLLAPRTRAARQRHTPTPAAETKLRPKRSRFRHNTTKYEVRA
jgi:hypothetical protein